MRLIAFATIALVLIPAASSAQSAFHSSGPSFAVSPPPVNAVQAQKGPTIESAAAGVRSAPAALDADAARARATRRSGIGHPAALIVVGTGSMVAGSFIGGEPGTFFLVGGAIVALYGLYQLVD